jgi:HEAT repeat protein
MDDTLSTKLILRWLRLAPLALAALAAPACSGLREGTTATSFLNRARSSDPNIRYQAYENLGHANAYDDDEQKAKAVQVLCAALDSKREGIACRAILCRTLGELGDKSARASLIRSIEDPEPLVRQEACRALGKVGVREDAPILQRIMELDRFADCKIAALDGLGDLKADDVRVLEVLVHAMDDGDPAIRFSSLETLKKITGKDLGIEPKPWQKYVEERMAANPPPPNQPSFISRYLAPLRGRRNLGDTPPDPSVPAPQQRAATSWTKPDANVKPAQATVPSRPN